MKKFYFVAALTALMTLLAPCAWGETETITANFQCNCSQAGTSPNTFTAKNGSTTDGYYALQKGYIISDVAYSVDPTQSISVTMNLGTYGGYSKGYNDVVFYAVDKNGKTISSTFSSSFTNKYTTNGGTPFTGIITLNEGQSGDEVYFKFSASSSATTTKCARFHSLSITYTTASCTKHNVNVSSDICGTVTANPTSACEGATVTLSYEENDNYYFNNYQVNGTDITGNTFTMPNYDVSVKGIFSSCDQLSAPTNVKTSSVTTTSATITWDAVANATGGYKVYVTDYDNFEKTEVVTTTSYSLTGLTANTQYAASVTAIGDGHRYCESDETDMDFTTSALAQLTTPTNLKESDVKYNAFNIQWDAVTGASKYQITITDAGTTTTGETTSTSYSFTGLTEKTSYIIKVKAIGDNATTYSDSKEAELRVTTAERKKYTITWSTPDNSFSPTTVLEDDALVLPTTTPAAPGGCPDKVFVGWSATNIGDMPSSTAPEFVSNAVKPTANTTYYAVFADGVSYNPVKFTVGDVGNYAIVAYNGSKYYAIPSNPTISDGKATAVEVTVSESNGVKYITSENAAQCTWTIASTSEGYTFYNGTNYLIKTPSNNVKLGLNTTSTYWELTADGDYTKIIPKAYTSRIIVMNSTVFATYTSTNSYYKTMILPVGGSSYTDYVTQCADCTAPQSPLSLTVNATTANLGEDGTVAIGFTCAEGNGATPTYTITPTTGCTINGKQLVFSAAGTYTITAQQDLSTVGGVTYCGGKDTKTITITKNPIFGTATIDKNTFDVACGDTTSMNSAATITLGTNYNLTQTITVTAPEGFLVSTNKTDNSKYATSVTLTPTGAGENAGKITGKVYVRAYSAIARSNGYSGDITITGTEITEQKIAVSSTVTCQEYELKTNDRGTVTSAGNYYTGATVTAPADPTGVCTDPINYVFDGWSATEVTDGATSYTKVDFTKYTMPKGGATLYAVYKYAAGSGSVTPTKVNADGIVDGAQYFITAANNGTEYILKAGAFATGGSEDYTVKFDKTSATSDMAWTFVKSGDNWMIKSGDNVLATENGNNKLYSNNSNTQTWICKNTTTTYIKITNVDNAKRNLALYNATSWRTYTTSDAIQSIQLYSATAYSFTSSPACGVYITGTKGIHVTSAKDIWVEAADTMEVSATSLDKNEDGAAVSISAEVTSGNFTIKMAGTSGSGSSKLTLTTNCSDASFTQKLIVVYKPTADNTTETGQIRLKVYKYKGSTEYATATIDVQGRSLPEQFVIAAKTTDGWVALPSDLETGSGSSVKAPYSITVDDEANPTKATQAPTTALYKGAASNTVNTCANAIRLQSVSANAYLQASTAADETHIWLSTGNSNEAQPWKLISSDFADYTVRVEKAEAGRYLGYDTKEGKIANYKQTATLRFLPVENTCTRYDAPSIKSTTAASNKVTLTWAEISGATAYEYSTDRTTWSSDNLSISTTGGITTATISGLTATTSYTLYIRVKITSGDNCSETATTTFTTTDCDDVPSNLSAYASSNSVTISWTANAATSTVKVYSDAAGANLVKDTTKVTSPCDLMGLKQNTKYYYQVFAGGSCGSAIEEFTTETSAISVVEWFQDSIIVNVNTEGSDVSVVIEGQKAHGSASEANIAEDLFFSKYYEATGNVKLVGVYNGTLDTLPLANVNIKIGHNNKKGDPTWYNDISMDTYGKNKVGYIAPNEEIILWYSQGNQFDPDITNCVEEKGYVDFTKMESNNKISFSGDQTITLLRDGTLIDVLGAVTSEGDPVQGKVTPSWGDDPGWAGKGYNIENQTEEIDLSTNRCLLVRSNKVKSGKNAVTNNVDTFMTFTKEEWLGRPVSKYKSDGTDDHGVESSCEGFAYVADFNYTGYYTAYDSIGGLREIDGHQNPDGTYTIPVNRIDTFACKDIRLVVKDNGTEMVNKTQRVPIMVVANTDTKNDTLFHFSADTCKKCDVVVRDNATLTHTNGGRNEFRDMYIYAGSHLNLPADQTFTLQTTHMHAKNDLVSYAIINNDNSTIKINKLVHVKRIDGHYWYPFSLPYDCKIADIVEQCGLDLGTYGTDWGIKYYDGQRRQAEATAASLGATGYHWYMMPSTGTLKANKGYIIALALPNEDLMRSIYFTPAGTSNYLEDGTEKYSYISNWSDNLTADARHHGWNFVGSPYISLFGEGTDGQGLNNTKMKMGRTNTETGEQEDTPNVYVSVPNGGNTNTYTQSVASGVTIYPFKAYFVQAIDPTTSSPATDSIKLTYTKSNTRLNAPARVQSTAKTIFAELNIANSDNSLRDNTGVLVGAFTADYEIGSDLTKMYAADVRPQLYTVDAAWGKMAYLAVADEAAHNISLGMYLPAAGSYTLSLNNDLSETGSADAVYLLYNGAVVANLLTMDYTFTATAAGTVNGYSLDIRRAAETTTADEWAEGDGPQAHYREGMLYVDNLPSGAEVYVYDVLGRLLLNTVATDAMVSMPTVTTGVYTILVRSTDSQTVLKTLLR